MPWTANVFFEPKAATCPTLTLCSAATASLSLKLTFEEWYLSDQLGREPALDSHKGDPKEQ